MNFEVTPDESEILLWVLEREKIRLEKELDEKVLAPKDEHLRRSELKHINSMIIKMHIL